MAPMAKPPRCPEHGIVLNPKGECTLCTRRSVVPASGGGLMTWVKPLLIALGALFVIGVVLFFVQRYQRDAIEAEPPPPDTHALPSDGRLRLHVDPPIVQGRRARLRATYSRRTEGHAMRGARVTGTGQDSIFYRLEAIQTMSGIDAMGRVSEYTYEVTTLRIGTTDSTSRPVLTGASVTVQPRVTGRPVVSVEGQQVNAGGNGVYEAFATMTPVLLGAADDPIYGVVQPRAVGESFPVSEAALRPVLDLRMHLDNAEITGNVRVVDASEGRGRLVSDINVEGARPRMSGHDGSSEGYTVRFRETLVVPYVEDGVRDYEANVETALSIRERNGNDVSRLMRYSVFERHERREIPED